LWSCPSSQRGYGPIVSRNATIRAETSIKDLLEMLDAKEAETAQEPVIDAQATSDGSWEVDGESVD
jgi:hypothetical protein